MKSKIRNLKIDKKTFFLVVLPFVLTVIASIFFQRLIITKPELIKAWMQSFGIFAVLIYIFLQALAIIIAPLGGFSLSVIVLELFGPFRGTALIFLVTTPLFFVNFMISRFYGRSLVSKLIGSTHMHKVDEYINKLGVEILILLKLFLNSNFDFISYAAGLTSISPMAFMLVNVFGGVPNALLLYLVTKKAPDFVSSVVILFVLPILLSLIYVLIYELLKRFGKLGKIVK